MPVPIMSGITTISETAAMPHGPGVSARRGRRASSVNMRAKLERSRQSARECRERKKLRYQYLEELISNREKAIFLLRKELEMVSTFTIAHGLVCSCGYGIFQVQYFLYF
jgi:hypothetical protein